MENIEDIEGRHKMKKLRLFFGLFSLFLLIIFSVVYILNAFFYPQLTTMQAFSKTIDDIPVLITFAVASGLIFLIMELFKEKGK